MNISVKNLNFHILNILDLNLRINKCNIGGSILKGRGTHYFKSGQIIKRDNVPTMISNIPKGKSKNGKGKRFIPIFRGSNHGKRYNNKFSINNTFNKDTTSKIKSEIKKETIRSGPKINKLYNLISSKGNFPLKITF